MGAGFVIFFWLIVFGILVVALFSFLAIAIYGHKKKSIILKLFGAIPATGIALIVVAVIGMIIYGIFSVKNPSNNFEQAFGKPPSEHIKNIKSDVYWFADTGQVYLTFSTNIETFKALVPKELRGISTKELNRFIYNINGKGAPEWWSFQSNENWVYYLRDHSHGDTPPSRNLGFASEKECLAYDPLKQIAYYHFLGID